MIKKYQKKPVVVSALQFTMTKDDKKNKDKFQECLDFIGMNNVAGEKPYYKNGFISIQTLEGAMNCTSGDYIIKGVKGEFYPCKPDIFKLTYEEVPEKETEEVIEETEEVEEVKETEETEEVTE